MILKQAYRSYELANPYLIEKFTQNKAYSLWAFKTESHPDIELKV